jgi:hypothetical protein
LNALSLSRSASSLYRVCSRRRRRIYNSLLLDSHGELRSQAITSRRLASPIICPRIIRRIDRTFRSPIQPLSRRGSHTPPSLRGPRSPIGSQEGDCRRRRVVPWDLVKTSGVRRSEIADRVRAGQFFRQVEIDTLGRLGMGMSEPVDLSGTGRGDVG